MSVEGSIDAALRRIDGDAVVALASALVRIPSHPGLPRQEERAAVALAEWFAARGLAPRFDEAMPGRPNVLATVRGARPGPHLLLCGHTDTVPLNSDREGVGFAGEVWDGRLWGRGAADMKGPLAAMAVALVALEGVLPAGSVTVAAVVDEEMESLGAERLIRSGFRADAAVVGEPTGNRIALGHKGLEWLAVELRGRAAHGGTPERGINAIDAAARLVVAVEERLRPRFAARRHPLLGPPTLNFGRIEGGDQPSTVAARCELRLDRRLVPGETYESAVAELEELLVAIEGEMPGLSTLVSRVPGGMATMAHGALDTAPGAAVASAAARARARLLGSAGEWVAFPAWTDGALLAEPGGIPTIVLGPGDLAVAHSPEESVPIAELEEAARLYAALAIELGAEGAG